MKRKLGIARVNWRMGIRLCNNCSILLKEPQDPSYFRLRAAIHGVSMFSLLFCGFETPYPLSTTDLVVDRDGPEEESGCFPCPYSVPTHLIVFAKLFSHMGLVWQHWPLGVNAEKAS